MSSPRRLAAVPGTGKQQQRDHRCRVAVQAELEGMQEVRVQAATAAVGPRHGQIAIRVGRLLMYVNDRDARWTAFSMPGSRQPTSATKPSASYRRPRRTGRGPADPRGRGCARTSSHSDGHGIGGRASRVVSRLAQRRMR